MEKLKILRQGPEHDREWMLVHDNGRFISQREFPQLAQVKPHFVTEKNILQVKGPGFSFELPLRPKSAELKRVQVWSTSVWAAPSTDEAHEHLSQFLGESVHLVQFSEKSERSVAGGSDDFLPETRFSDSRPVLLLNSKSLENLNSKLKTPVPMSRFRGNIIYDGAEAFEEDEMKRWQAGSVSFGQRKSCARCVIINMDQVEGKLQGPEPLKTLTTYRKQARGVMFGSLYSPEKTGEISLGDSLTGLD